MLKIRKNKSKVDRKHSGCCSEGWQSEKGKLRKIIFRSQISPKPCAHWLPLL